MNTNRRIRLIGPSGHKSEYHCATLLQNWQEDRLAFGHKDSATEPLDSNTTYRVSYKGTSSTEELFAAKPPECFCAEAPKELLFFHGDVTAPPRHQYSVSELSYANTGQPNPLNTILNKEGISLRRDKTNALRRTMLVPSPTAESVDTLGTFNATTSTYRKGASAKPAVYDEECTTRVDRTFVDSSRSHGYRPIPLPPIGRVNNKERFLTTKNVSIDLEGEYLKNNIDEYPLTSSKCWGQFMAYKDNPMQRTKLRDEYVD